MWVCIDLQQEAEVCYATTKWRQGQQNDRTASTLRRLELTWLVGLAVANQTNRVGDHVLREWGTGRRQWKFGKLIKKTNVERRTTHTHTYQLLKVDQVVMEGLVSFVDEGDVWVWKESTY